MTPHRHPSSSASISVLQQIAEEDALLKALDRKDAEIQRRRTQRLVKEMADASTPECRIAAARARARAVYTQIDDINAQGDLAAVQEAPAVAVDLRDVRIDDLGTLFIHRERLPPLLRERIEKIHAKINWQTRKGKKGYFNVAVHKNHIGIDKALAILAHLQGIHDGTGRGLDRWTDSIIECGLFPKIKKGKFQYSRRCQDGDHCELCNYLNISDGLKTLLAGYDRSAFNSGGNWFAITVAPRADAARAGAVGRALTPSDWHYENADSIVYRESHCSRVFRYPDAAEADETGDWAMEDAIRRFLGAVQSTWGKLIKNGWLDGVRARVENSVEFLPFASHQHWHAVGSSICGHDPQQMAGFVKEEVDAILAQTCPGLYADVMVAVIPTPEDLRRWVKYMHKTVKVGEAVESVYNRHPAMRRGDAIYERFMQELRLFPEREHRVFGMIRHRGVMEKRGSRTYMLRRRYVGGKHKFAKGSILSEPERHRLWRERHAEMVALARHKAKERKKEKDPLDRRSRARPKLVRQAARHAPGTAPRSPRSASSGTRATKIAPSPTPPSGRPSGRPSKAQPIRLNPSTLYHP